MRLRNLRQLCRCGNDPAHGTCSQCPPGEDGPPGLSMAFIVEDEAPGINLPNGGYKFTVGGDANMDGIPDTGIQIFYLPNGAPGNDGATPTFILGTVTTLAPGSSATAALVATGNPNEYQLNLGLPAGIQGVPGPQLLQWGRTAFVDDQFGVDATGVVGDATKPYKTIQAANNAIVAAGFANSGLRGVIYVRNGSYSTTTGVVINDWIDIIGDSFTIICTNVSNPALTLGARTHVIAPAATISHTIVGGKALYQSTFYSGKIELNKVQGAIDINSGGSSFTMKVRDVLPTSAVNTPSGFGDLASGNIMIRNAVAELEFVNCWSTVRVSDTGTGSVVKLRGYFRNGAWVEQNSIIETGNAEITRNNSTTSACCVFVDNGAALKTFATKIKGTAVALSAIILNAAASRSYHNSTVLVSFGGSPVITGNAAAAFYNFGALSGNIAPTVVTEPLSGSQPIYINAAVV